MKTILKAASFVALFACLAHADGVPPVVPISGVLFGSAQKLITSSTTAVNVDTTTFRLNANKGVKTSTLTFNDGTILTSTNSIIAAAVWGGITGTIGNQSDLQTKFNAVGTSTAALQASVTALTASTTTLVASITALTASTTTLGASVSTLSASTTSINATVLSHTASIVALTASTTTLQTQVNSIATSTGTLSVSTTSLQNQINLMPTLAGNNIMTGQNSWTTPKTSTFTYGVLAGSMTVGDLSASLFVKTDANKKLTSYDLLGDTLTFRGGISDSSPFGISNSYGIQTGTLTLNSLPGAGPLRGASFVAVTTGPINMATETTGLLPVANGGTGTASPSLVSGSNVSITGTWPNQTVNAISGGASSLAIATGSITTSTIISSPTSRAVFDSSVFTASLVGATSSFIGMNYSSMTAQGNTFNIANKLVKLTSGGQYPAVDGNLITNVNYTSVTGAPASYVPYGTAGGLTTSSNMTFDGSTLTVAGASTLYSAYGSTTAPLSGFRIHNPSYAGSFWTLETFTSGPVDPQNTLGNSWGSQNFGSTNINLPSFGLWNSAGAWVGGFQGGTFGNGGFEVGTSLGRNTGDFAGSVAIGSSWTVSGASVCGFSSNLPCGSLAPTDGLLIQGNILTGAKTQPSGNAQTSIISNVANKYALYIGTATVGGWSVSVDTFGALSTSSETVSGPMTVGGNLLLTGNALQTPSGSLNFSKAGSAPVGISADSSGNFGILASNGSSVTIGAGSSNQIAINSVSGVTVTSATVSGFFQLDRKTIAQLHAITPASAYQEYGCSDCTVDTVAYSTGTAIGAWGEGGSKTTFPH